MHDIIKDIMNRETFEIYCDYIKFDGKEFYLYEINSFGISISVKRFIDIELQLVNFIEGVTKSYREFPPKNRVENTEYTIARELFKWYNDSPNEFKTRLKLDIKMWSLLKELEVHREHD